MFEKFDPIWTDWVKVLELYRFHRDWEAENFPGSWRHELYAGYVKFIELMLERSADLWTPEEMVRMERYSAIGEAFWYKKLGKGRKK